MLPVFFCYTLRRYRLTGIYGSVVKPKLHPASTRLGAVYLHDDRHRSFELYLLDQRFVGYKNSVELWVASSKSDSLNPASYHIVVIALVSQKVYLLPTIRRGSLGMAPLETSLHHRTRNHPASVYHSIFI